MILKDDRGKELPKKAQKQLNDYIERVKEIKWFQPDKNLNKKDLEKQIKLSLEAFGVKAKIEYRKLEKAEDWNTALDTALDVDWDIALNTARDIALGAALDVDWYISLDDSALGAALDDAARDIALGAADLLASNLDSYKDKYPKGNFINLIPIWEMGLYPIGVVNGKFIVYIPPCKLEFPEIK